MSEQQLYADEGVVFAALAGATVIWLIAGRVQRGRPGLDLRWPLLSAFGLRVIAAAALNFTSFGPSVRGGDEPGNIVIAHQIASGSPLGGGWGNALTHQLWEFVLAGEIKLFSAPDMALRAGQAALTVLGLGLIAAAVYELAGARSARLTAWILAIEPANVFFSSVIHKEPMMFLAEGLVAFGGAVAWRRARLLPVALMTLGCLIAVGTRPYAGWFLIAASAAILLHAALRNASGRAVQSVALLAVVAGLVVISTPAVINASSRQELAKLQSSQNANASDQSNLKLAPVDFSNRGAVLRNLPRRVFDLTFRPYPWQLGNVSQRLGVLETLFVLGGLVLLLRAAVRGGVNLFRRTGPLVYPALMLLVAYSLSAGNAGTSFRYRTHLVALAIGVFAALWRPRAASVESHVAKPALGRAAIRAA